MKALRPALAARNNGYAVGSANVFADLGVPRPEEALAKAELAHQITIFIERCCMTQAEAAALLDVDQPKISALHRRRLSGFSLDRPSGCFRIDLHAKYGL